MLKVLIADDEPRVGLLIKQLIQWDAHELELVGIYNDGQSAFDAIEQMHPNIVITDIRMPILSGLDLIQLAIQKYADIHFVVVSGYRNFEYAHTAIKYGVEDYLLKPIDEDELNEVLAKICRENSEKIDGQVHVQQMETRLNSSARLLLRELLDNMSKGAPSPNLQEINASYGTGFTSDEFVACVIKIDCIHPQANKRAQERIILNRLCQIIDASLHQCTSEFLYATYRGMEIDIFINYKKEFLAQTHNALQQLMTESKNYIGNFDSYTVTMGQSEDTHEFCSCTALLLQAKRAMQRKLFEGTGSKLKITAQDMAADECKDGYYETHQAMIQNSIDLMQREELERQIAQSFLSLEKNKGQAWEYYRLAQDLLDLFAKWAESRGFQMAAEVIEQIEDACASCTSVRMLQQCVADGVGDQLSLFLKKRQEMDERPIQEAMQYIQINYAGKISLEAVAGKCGFNVTYFSELFKKKAGKTFSDYLSGVRIDAAKTLLRDTRKTVYEIAENVGYKDSKYFSQQFVKAVGIKPTEYRKLYY